MKRVILLLLLALVIVGFAFSAHVMEEDEEGDFEYETEDAFIEDDDVAEVLMLEGAIAQMQALSNAAPGAPATPANAAAAAPAAPAGPFNATQALETLRESVNNATIRAEIWHNIRHQLKNGKHELGHPARAAKRVERAKKRGFFTWHDNKSYEKMMHDINEIKGKLNQTDASYNTTLHDIRKIRNSYYKKFARSLFREQTKYREYTLKNLNLYGVMVPIVNLTKPDLAKVYEEMEAYWMEIYVRLTPLSLELSLAKVIDAKKFKGIVLHDGADAKRTASKLGYGTMYDLPEFATYAAKENEFKQKLNGKVHNTATAVFELRMAFASKFITALGNLHKTYMKNKPVLYVKSSDRAVKSWQYLSTAQLDLEHFEWKSISHTLLEKEQ